MICCVGDRAKHRASCCLDSVNRKTSVWRSYSNYAVEVAHVDAHCYIVICILRSCHVTAASYNTLDRLRIWTFDTRRFCVYASIESDPDKWSGTREVDVYCATDISVECGRVATDRWRRARHESEATWTPTALPAACISTVSATSNITIIILTSTVDSTTSTIVTITIVATIVTMTVHDYRRSSLQGVFGSDTAGNRCVESEHTTC